MTATSELTADEDKLFALARSARARIEARAGAAVMDETGRSYSAAEVSLPHLSLTALQVAVAAAAAAGARTLQAAVVVGAEHDGDAAVFADLAAPGADLLLCHPDRSVAVRWTAP